MTEYSKASLLVRYTIHGFAFSLMTLAMSFVFGPVLGFLTFVGLLIGLIIDLLIYVMAYALVNAFLMSRIWQESVKTDWKSLLEHGFVLGIALLLVSVPIFVINFIFPNEVVSVIMFILYCPIDGYVARNIAGLWIDEDV